MKRVLIALAFVASSIAVTGIVDVRNILTNANARVGDLLVLTKPLGTGIATTAPRNVMANMTNPGKLIQPAAHAVAGMNAPIISRYTGCRAEQLISGATRMVVIRSRRFSMTRVAITPGIAQANEDISGTNDLPLSPTRVINLSIRKAARAM